MDVHEKSKLEFLNELNELQQKYDSVLELYEKKIEESKQAEKKLRENQANIKAIIENSLDSVWSIDTNYNIKYINEIFVNAFKQSFGVQLCEGKNIVESLPPQLQSVWKERYDRAFKNEHFIFTDKIEVENGSLYVEVSMNPIVIDGKVVGASFFGKDVTERMHSAEALRESEERFKALHNASFGGIVIHDKGIILDCNQGISSITGYSAEELIGMDGLILIAEQSRELVIRKIKDGEEEPYEAIGIRKNGEEFPVRLEARNIPYKGKIVRSTEFRDISDQKKAEAAFWESQVNFRALFEKGPIGVAYHKMIFDESGIPVNFIILDANKSYQRLTGVNPIGKLVTEAFPGIENDSFDWIGTCGKVVKTGVETRFQKLFQINQKWYDCVAYQYKPDHFVSAFFDITEQKHAELALKESEEIFRHFMENSPIYIFFKDKALRALNLSKNYEQMFGLPMEKLIGKTMDELFPSDLAKRMIADDKNILSEGKPAIVDEEMNGRFYTTIKFPIIINGVPEYLAGYTIDITERKQAEDTLRGSEGRMKILFNYAPEAYFLMDIQGNFIDGNIAAEKLIGYSKDELLGKSFFEINLLTNSYLEKALDLLEAGISGKSTGPDELMLIRKDGTKVLVEITIHPVNIDGHTMVLGIVRDISERKRAEMAMQLASENWKRTFQAMRSGIALLDGNEKIIQTNLAFQNFLNEKESNLLGKSCFSLILRKGTSTDKNQFERMKISKACETFEIDIKGKIYEILIDPILGKSNEITGAVLIMNDISQRKRDENIQQILHEITGAHLFEKSISELLIIVRNELSKVIDTANFFVALYQPETDTLRKVIFEDENDDFVEWDARKSLSGQVLKLRKPLLLKRHEETTFAKENNIELLGSPAACWLGVPLIDGEKTLGVMVVQNYTDENAYDMAAIRLLILIAHELSIIIVRKKMIQDLVAAKDRAEESDRLKSAFLANMSHEIRTPMNGILGFAELLREPKLSGEEQQMFIDIIEKSGERMLNIINDLIDISKIESGQMDVCLSETNINEQLDFLYNFFKLEAKNKGLKLIVVHPLPNGKSNISTDKEKVYAILTNLIKNALKFTKSGYIEFGYRFTPDKLVFYTKDTGIGVPENKLKTIFERFIQISTGMSNVYEGAGLGLAISKAYVEMLGGEIWLESKQGEGTCFYFTIPLKYSAETAIIKVNNKFVNIDQIASEQTILIAEDDEISLFYLTHILKTSNLKIIVAKTGQEAVELCRKHKYISLVLMDINLPVIDGHIAAQIIKEFRPNLPILAQTAFALDKEKEKYSDTFDDYITKPIKPDELKLKMKKFLKFADI